MQICCKIIIQPATSMDDLSLILASRELFLALSTLKAKTLKQAEENNKLHHNIKIDQLVKQYDNNRIRVAQEIKRQTPIKWNHSLKNQFEADPLRYYFSRPSIIEIVGAKGSGKTALLLQLALNYHSVNPGCRIRILNCAGGITQARLWKLGKLDYEYCDIFGMEDLLEYLHNCKEEKMTGLLAIDSQVNLLLGYEKQKIGLGELLLVLRGAGWSIYFTNYTQSKLQIQQKEGINLMSYFSQTFGGIPQCRLAIEPQQRSENNYSIKMIKSLDNKYYHFSSRMSSSGFDQISLLRKS